MADLQHLAADWATISARLDDALALPAHERASWLAALDAPAALKDKLRQLLANADGVETGDFAAALPKLTLAPDGALPSAADGPCAGDVVGVYRLISELGVGGMGVVWLAERVAGPLQQRVALKLPRASWTRGLAERMGRERDILASLDHPLIARIHDAGVDPRGRPYLALEYVEGTPIDAYCKAAALPLAARLALVLQVADAVAHAHARLVVHRDLKPANILVTAQGQVRLLDFGIAKLMEGERTAETALTQQAGRVLTLDYASPEQIRGAPIGTASDVYSLGVVAYELLTEAKPYQLKRQSAAALEEAIDAVDVRPASSAAADPATRRALRGDLDAILNKALKKDPAERYAGVRDFARDIERHLQHLPVHARPDAPAYRLRKFARRNALAVVAAAAVGVSLAGGLSLALWQAREALAQADRAQRVKQFVLAIFSDADSNSEAGIARSAAELLKLARQRIGVETGGSPDVAVELMTAVAQSMVGQGMMDDAAGLLRETVALSTRQFGAQHGLTCAAQNVLAELQVELGHNQDAVALLQPCITASRAGGDLQALNSGLRWLSTAQFNQGHIEAGVAAASAAVATLDARSARGKALTPMDAMLSHQAYADALGQADKPGAVAAARVALAAARRVYGDQLVRSVIDIRSMLALALVSDGQLDEGLRELQPLIPATERLLGPKHGRVSKIAHLVGNARLSAGDVRGAIAAYQRSVEVEDANTGPEANFDRGVARYFLGSAVSVLSPQQAVPVLAESERLLRLAAGPTSPRTLRVASTLAWQLAEAGQLDEADARFASLAAAPFSAADLAGHQRRLSALRSLQGRHAEALQLAESASQSLSQIANKNLQARGLLQLGAARLGAGDAAQALPPLREAQALFAQMQLPTSPERARVALLLGRAQLQQGDAGAAQASLAAAAATWAALDPGNRHAGLAFLHLAQAQLAQGDRPAATASLQRAQAVLAGSTFAADRALLQALQQRLAG